MKPLRLLTAVDRRQNRSSPEAPYLKQADSRAFGPFHAALRRFANDSSGSVLVEFALVLPLFLVLLFGSIAWGISLMINDAMYDAARVAARDLAVIPVNSEPEERLVPEQAAEASARARLEESFGRYAFVVDACDSRDFEVDESPACPGQVRVTISTPNFLAQNLTYLTLDPFLTAEVVMQKEGP